jgi:hypothetical protein
MISWQPEFWNRAPVRPWRYAAARLLREGGPSIDSWPVRATVREQVGHLSRCREFTGADISLDTRRRFRRVRRGPGWAHSLF